MVSATETIPEETRDVPPDPSFTLKTLRNIGYSLESAISDIIDNSISANAQNVWINSHACQFLMISDDGDGLSKEEIVTALTIGGVDCEDIRDKTDLGRFGMGLKLASFSQCKTLTLASKLPDGTLSAWQWDLDRVANTRKWKIHSVSLDNSRYLPIIDKMKSLQHGTVVYWEKLDIHAKGYPDISKKDVENFEEKLGQVRKYLGMIFHEFITSGKLQIIFTDKRPVKAWNPFLSDSHAIRIPLDSSHVPGIRIQPYILPHRSKLSDREYESACGPFPDWNQAQGFYVYRGGRLISYGTWFGMRGFSKKKRETNLARIKLDITNCDDSLWEIDVMKTSVKLPGSGPYRDIIKYVAARTCGESEAVYSCKGTGYRKKKNPEYRPVWDFTKVNGYRLFISREHPLIAEFLANLPDENRKEAEMIFRLIEETIPVSDILTHESQNPEIRPNPFENADDDVELMLRHYRIIKSDKLTYEEKERELLKIEPFSERPELIKRYLTPGALE